MSSEANYKQGEQDKANGKGMAPRNSFGSYAAYEAYSAGYNKK